jgi:ABC-type Fe3+/spermidine/putrescine transport system ATPase subunit
MHAGRIEQVGAPMALYDAPATPFVRDFLGKTVLVTCWLAEFADGSALARLDGAPGVSLLATPPFPPGLAVGDRCQLAVRPERLAITPGTVPGGGENALLAIVEALFFLGDRFEARLGLPGGQQIHVALPRSAAWREGEPVTVVLPREAVRLWPA